MVKGRKNGFVLFFPLKIKSVYRCFSSTCVQYPKRGKKRALDFLGLETGVLKKQNNNTTKTTTNPQVASHHVSADN